MDQNRSSHNPSKGPFEPEAADTEQPVESEAREAPQGQRDVEGDDAPNASETGATGESEAAPTAPPFGKTVAFTSEDLEDVAEAAAEAAAASAALDSLSHLTTENVVDAERPEVEIDLDQERDDAGRPDVEPAPKTDGETNTQGPEERPADLPLTQVFPSYGPTRAVDDTIDAAAPQTARKWTGPVDPEAVKARRKSRVLTTICIVAIILVIVGCFAYFGDWGQKGSEGSLTGSSTNMCSVTISVDIEGLDIQTGSKIPIEVEGEDVAGNTVSQVQYLDETGAGVSLVAGTYTLTVAASPIAGDGTIYTVPETVLEVTVESDGQDLSDEGVLSFSIPSAETVTDSQINAAYTYAAEGGCTSEALAQILKEAAVERRDAAVEASEARTEELLEEADERHKATPAYSFDIPEEWYGSVETWQNGNTVGICLADDPDITLVTLTLQEDGYDEGTTEYGVLGAVSLGDGTSVVVEGPVWPWLLSQTLSGQTDELSTTYSSSEAELLVELTTGKPYTSAQIRELADDDDSVDELTEMVEAYLAEVLLPSIEAS